MSLTRRLLSVLASVTLAATLVPSAQAASEIKPKDAYPTHIVEVVENAFSSPISDQDALILKDNYPELAALTPDFRPSSIESNLNLRTSPSISQAGSGCSGATGTNHARTLLGLTYFKMHTSVDFCWSGNQVNSVSNLRTHFTEVTSTARIDGEHHRETRPGYPGYARHAYMVSNEVPVWGTVGVMYPYNQFNLYAGGGAAHFTG